MAIEVSLSNGKTWLNKASAKDYFRKILNRYSDEDRINSAADIDDLLALLERYDEGIPDGKIGCGVEYFFRRKNSSTGWSSSSFWVHRIDGSETDFSFASAISASPKSESLMFNDACRLAVASDLLAAKHNFFENHPEADEHGFVPCEVSGDLITFHTAHIDHVEPTFRQLVMIFRAINDWNHSILPGVLTAAKDGQFTTSFADQNVADQFRSLHKKSAVCRVISSRANLALSSGQRAPKIKFQVKI